ncbi:hypothetical protein F5I97DRAFT_1817136 [Phlebopus sp. FC_14]|nr:hypothetical protein F5I97DRAFT_1817136 [Phlebopus sp. FC_14]
MAVVTNPSDISSELLVAQLLEEDLQRLHNAQEAERIQLEAALSFSALKNGRVPNFRKKGKGNVQENVGVITDADIAMEIFLSEARSAGDRAFAESMQVAQDAELIAGTQHAQKVAAAEKKILLDAEFARRLQAANDNGELDMDNVKDVERLLGREEVERILAADLNGKGKESVKQEASDEVDALRNSDKGKGNFDEDVKPGPFNSYPNCGICFEAFQVTHSPVTASQTATSSNRLPFGLYLPCPNSHAYCQSCLAAYVQSKIDPVGGNGGSPELVVFPIKCPECPADVWTEGIPDDVAERILSEKNMVIWHSQKILESMEHHYCPNPRCSALVQLHEDPDEPMATCPSCGEAMCVACKVLWHEDLTCEEYMQALPEDERSPEDQLVFMLAKVYRVIKCLTYLTDITLAKNWRRCPTCSRLVELAHGCNHITCLCGTHFCFKCGSRWNVRDGKCTRKPSCDLWDEHMLLEERERRRVADLERLQGRPAMQRVQAAQPPPPYQAAAPPVHRAPHIMPAPAHNDGLEWVRDPQVLCGHHAFTRRMISSLVCGYCNAHATSLADLLYHLLHVRHHPVYACCGRFFPRELDFERHCEARVVRFGGHVHRFVRN